MKNPETNQEWQDAVEWAEVLLLIDSARQYGLISGGSDVNIERCLEIIDQGKQRGFTPHTDAVERLFIAWSQ